MTLLRKVRLFCHQWGLRVITGGYEWLRETPGSKWSQTLQTNIQKYSHRVGIIYIHLDHHCYDHCRQVIIIFLMTTMVVLTRSPYVLGPYLETCYRRRAEPRARKQISGPSPFILSCYNSWDILLLRLRQAQASLFDLQLIATNNNYDYKLIWVNNATYWSVGFSQELATLGF